MKYEWIVEIDDDEDFHLEDAKWKQELVRCKDCQFRRGEKKGFCYGIEKYTNDDDFCSRGEMTRQEAIKNLKKLRSFHCGSYAKAIDVAIEAMGLEVVYCKNCKHYKGLAECEVIGDCMGTDGYCAWGERKEDVDL